ncbi:MAG: cbb3-type cytochrome oxidase assembly protein CcoS [Planctomycetota bacterium]
MSVIYVMAPAALLLAAAAVAAFIWATRDGQYDDTETPAHRILFDDPVDHQDDVDRETRE